MKLAITVLIFFPLLVQGQSLSKTIERNHDHVHERQTMARTFPQIDSGKKGNLGKGRSKSNNPFSGRYTGIYQTSDPNCFRNYESIDFEFDQNGQLIDFFYSGGRLGAGRPTSFEGNVSTTGEVSWTLYFVHETTTDSESWKGRLSTYGGGGTMTTSYLPCGASWTVNRGTAEQDSIANRPEDQIADPVDAATGAFCARHVWFRLATPSALSFTMEYNSSALATGRLGIGWGFNYEARLYIPSPEVIVFNWTQQRRNYFSRVGAGPDFLSNDRAMRFDTITANSDGTYSLVRQDQSRMRFNVIGRLTQVVNSNGQATNLTYGHDQDPTLVTAISDVISGKTLLFSYDDSRRISLVTDPMGRRLSFVYDSSDHLISIQLKNTSDEIVSRIDYSSDSGGRILTGTDREGVTFVTNTYDNRGRVSTQDDGVAGNQLTRFYYDALTEEGYRTTQVTNRDGETMVYAYDKNLLKRYFQNTNGEKRYFDYDSDGNLTRVTDELDASWSFAYDSYGNLLSTSDPQGATTAMTYDSRNNLTNIRDALGKETLFTYDPKNNRLSIKNPLNQITRFEYDVNSLMTRHISPRNGITQYTYTGGLPTAIQDPNDLTSTLAYDSAGRVTAVTDPAGKSISMTYSVNDDLLTYTDQRGKTTNYIYDSKHQRIKRSDPLNLVTRWSYDGNGNVLEVTDPLNNFTRFGYDGEDRLVKVTDAKGNFSQLHYDVSGRLVGTTDASGHRRSVRLDAKGRPIRSSDTRGNSSETEFDSRDLPMRVRDALGRSATVDYDEKGRAVSTTNPLGQKVQLRYDDLDRLVQVTDALNLVTKQSFDADGNRIGMTDGRNATTVFAYDLADRMTSTTTGGGRVTGYSYNERSFLSSIVEPSGQTTHLTYDDAARLIRVVDPVGQIDYGYDDGNRLVSTSSGGSSITRVYDELGRLTRFTDSSGNVLEYEYDKVGNLTLLRYPDGKTVSYTHDTANRLISVKDWVNRVTSYTYDADGRLATTTRPNGTVESRGWDEAGQLISIVDKKGPTVVSQINLGYDPAGRLIEEQRLPGGADYVPIGFSASYDSDNRLTRFNGTGVTFDDDGNMTNGPLVTGAGNAVFTYDARNRLTSFGGTAYTYDAESRRQSSTTAGGTTSYVTSPLSGMEEVLVRTAPDGTVSLAVYGLGLLYEETGSSVRYFHYDFRGSAVSFTDNSGAVIGTVGYGPHGEIAQRSGNTATPYLFNARYGVMVDENELYFMRSRYYHQGIKRFINQDTIIGHMVNGASMNRFSYANGDPISLIDPFGTSAIGDWIDRNRVRLEGAQRLALGLADTIAGGLIAVGTSWTGVGAVAGGVIALHGVDQAFAGLRTLLYGEHYSPYAAQAIAKSFDVDISEAEMYNDMASVAGGVVGLVRGLFTLAGKYAPRMGVETVQRAMSRAELEAIQGSGVLSRGGRGGDHFVSDAVNSTVNRARQRLALPGSPEVRVTLEVPSNVFSTPSKVQPKFNMPGGGMERTAPGNLDIPATVKEVFDYIK